MGVDCYLVIDGDETYLDRWHIFSDKIKSTEEMSKHEALSRIKKLMESAKDNQHNMVWLTEARDKITELKDDGVCMIIHDFDMDKQEYACNQ